jgi:hypothetical protein
MAAAEVRRSRNGYLITGSPCGLSSRHRWRMVPPGTSTLRQAASDRYQQHPAGHRGRGRQDVQE